MHNFKYFSFILILVFASQGTLSDSTTLWSNLFKPSKRADANGGSECAVCTLIFLLLSHVKQYYNVTSTETLPLFCSFLPIILKTACYFAVVSDIGAVISEQLESGENADVICHGLGFCYTEPGRQTCHLLPDPQQGLEKAIQGSIKRNKVWRETMLSDTKIPDICNIADFVQQLCQHIDYSLSHHEAVIDVDGDGFSAVDVLRGYNWRGVDCNDYNADIYPGRIPIYEDRYFDSNCNGIWGVNPISGLAYETELCQGSGQRGLIHFGDSAGSHFRIPPDLFDVTKLKSGAWDHFLHEVSNEFDWPELSFGTGHANNTWSIVQNVSTNSIFWRLRNRNLCNNNDYHNHAYNGGRSSNVLRTVNFNTTRNKNADYPALVIYAFMGNDVCNGHEDTVKSMTTPEEFRKNVLEFFDHMEEVLPAGSHILTIGLVNLEVLYSAMSGHLHPLGYLNSDITYDIFYDWLNCILISPCFGITSANESLRNETAQRANDLNAVLEEVSNSQTYKNFDVKYFRTSILKVYEQNKDEFFKLIEPFDGFHPNRILQNVFADDIWEHIIVNFSEFVGKENALNPWIRLLFGLR